MAKGISQTGRLDVTGFGRDQSDLPEVATQQGSGYLDLRGWFPQDVQCDSAGNLRPIEIELGSGKGTFLAQEVPHHPESLFLGIEWAAPFYRYAADRMRRLNFKRVQMLRADGVVFIRNYVPDASISVFHWYFPDPWPKARHNKRRTFQEPFLRELHRVLAPGGRISVATDHLDYWQWMQIHAQKVSDIFEIQPFARPHSAGPGELVGTNFERKYISEGRQFNGMVLAKKSSPQ